MMNPSMDDVLKTEQEPLCKRCLKRHKTPKSEYCVECKADDLNTNRQMDCQEARRYKTPYGMGKY